MLRAVTYKPHGNSRLEYGPTRFPIVPVINGYAEGGDKVRVIAILTDGDNTTHNFLRYFAPEIEAIVGLKGLVCGGIEVIPTADSEDIDTQLKLFGDIIESIGDGEDIHACITYGTKPTPIVETMALNYAHRLKEDVTIGCIVYGRHNHDDDGQGKNGIYDTTALFRMDSMVNKLAETKTPNPKTAIKAMLRMAGGDDGGFEP
jgi:hypothetical protein